MPESEGQIPENSERDIELAAEERRKLAEARRILEELGVNEILGEKLSIKEDAFSAAIDKSRSDTQKSIEGIKEDFSSQKLRKRISLKKIKEKKQAIKKQEKGFERKQIEDRPEQVIHTNSRYWNSSATAIACLKKHGDILSNGVIVEIPSTSDNPVIRLGKIDKRIVREVVVKDGEKKEVMTPFYSAYTHAVPRHQVIEYKPENLPQIKSRVAEYLESIT